MWGFQVGSGLSEAARFGVLRCFAFRCRGLGFRGTGLDLRLLTVKAVNRNSNRARNSNNNRK